MANPRELFGRALGTVPLRQRRPWPLLPVLLAAMLVGGVATLGFQHSDIDAFLLDLVPGSAVADSVGQRDFSVCGSGGRVTCIVDGDTFWLDGMKIRIADINTPEVGSPQCASEAELGRQATSRLRQLLSAGPFDLGRVDRDQDQYGRKLRVVTRNGHSIGDVLVAEGLAHSWQGRRESWC